MKVAYAILFSAMSLLGKAQSEKDSIATAFLHKLNERLNAMPGQKFNTFDAYSISGTRYTSDSLKGKVSVINFWFQACPPCMAETEGLNQLYNEFKKHKNFQFISFTFDSTAQTSDFVKKYNIAYPVICLPEDKVHKLNYGFGFPVTAITDTSGIIIYFSPGGSTDPQKANESLKKEVYPRLKEMLKAN
ncbi:MAG: peroxiredoxin family protein [Flavisolibacter sp.]